jgi:transposase
MLTGKHRDACKERFWRRVVRQWRTSGLSVRAFCEQHDLPQASFYGWRRTLAERDAKPRPFMPVHVVPEEKAVDGDSASASGLELRLPHDRVVRIGQGFDAGTLQRLLALLEEGRAC